MHLPHDMPWYKRWYYTTLFFVCYVMVICYEKSKEYVFDKLYKLKYRKVHKEIRKKYL